MQPADILLVIIIGVVLLAFVLAPLFARKPSDHGLRYEYQIKRKPRKQ